jgi:hypothetical protein
MKTNLLALLHLKFWVNIIAKVNYFVKMWKSLRHYFLKKADENNKQTDFQAPRAYLRNYCLENNLRRITGGLVDQLAGAGAGYSFKCRTEMRYTAETQLSSNF